MTRHATFMLLGLALLGLAVAVAMGAVRASRSGPGARASDAGEAAVSRGASEGGGTQLRGANGPSRESAGAAPSQDGLGADMATHLRSILPDRWTANWHFAINPVQAQRIVRETPGRIDALIRFCLGATESTPGDIGSYACELVTAYFSSATDDYVEMDPELDVTRRRQLVEAVLSGLEENPGLPEVHAVSALRWLPYLDFDGEAFDAQGGEPRILDVAEPMLRRRWLGAAAPLARLDVAPRAVADAVFFEIETMRGDVAHWARVLLHPDVSRILAQYGGSASDSVIDGLEACRSEPSYGVLALRLRVARQDPWDVIETRLQDLAVQRSLSNWDFVSCLQVATAGHPSESVRAMAGLLRRRPLLSLSEMGLLLHDSVDWRSTAHVIELLERDALYWDAKSYRLRQ